MGAVIPGVPAKSSAMIFFFTNILWSKEWTIVSNGFIMNMIRGIFEIYVSAYPRENWKENEK